MVKLKESKKKNSISSISSMISIYSFRVKRLQKLMRQKELDVVILTAEGESYNNNIIYYTGFIGNGYLFTRQRSNTLYVSKLEEEKAKKTGTKTVVIDKKSKDNQIAKLTSNPKRVGIDAQNMSVYEFRKLKKITKGKYVDISSDLLEIRSIKDDTEIKNIQKACNKGDEIFMKVIEKFNSKKPFKTEIELKSFIENGFRNFGLEISFPAIASSGKNASIIHHNSGPSKLRKGFLIMDFGCKVNGYCSDMTRTIYIGKPSQAEIKRYEKLLDVQEKTINYLSSAKTTGEVDKFCRDELGEDERLFTHGLGHGVGLNIHELPNLKPEVEDIILPGQVLTVEPGIYEEEKFGMRIEDTVLITKSGPKILTKSKKDLIIVGQ